MLVKFVCLLLIVPAAVLAGPPFELCPGVPKPLVNVLLNVICDSECPIPRNGDTQHRITFKSPVAAETATATLRAEIDGVWQSWPLEPNACKNLIWTECPLTVDQEAWYNYNIRLPKSVPIGTRALMEVRLTSPKNETILCTRVRVVSV